MLLEKQSRTIVSSERSQGQQMSDPASEVGFQGSGEVGHGEEWPARWGRWGLCAKHASSLARALQGAH